MKRYSMRNPQLGTWLGGLAIGAMAMYLADPAQGKRRRGLVQEKMRIATEKTGNALEHAMHSTGNQLSQAQVRAKSMLRRKEFDDESLKDRLRNAIAMLASVPEEIRIKAEQGKVTLTGAVAAKEKNRLLRKLRRMPGVRELRDELELKSTDRRSWRRKEARKDAFDESATDASQAVESTGRTIKGMARRLPIGALLAVAGLGYTIQRLGKNVQTQPRSQDSGRIPESSSRTYGSSRTGDGSLQEGTIDLQKSIEIQASPETVFNIWSKYDNFPQFMSHLVEVQSLGGQRSHWLMQGPAGVNIEWDAELTEYLEPTTLAWKTEPGAPVEHSGSIRFEASDGGTLATVRMYYKPEAGQSNSLAALLGSDPEKDLEDDLLRMKNFIEGTNFPHENAQIAPSSGQVLH